MFDKINDEGELRFFNKQVTFDAIDNDASIQRKKQNTSHTPLLYTDKVLHDYDIESHEVANPLFEQMSYHIYNSLDSFILTLSLHTHALVTDCVYSSGEESIPAYHITSIPLPL